MFGQAFAELTLPKVMADMINNGMMLGDSGYVLQKGGVMLLVALLSSGCSIVGSFLSAQAALGLGRDLRDKVFTKVLSYSLDEFSKIGTASLITRTTNDITQIQTTVVMAFRFIIYSPIMCIGGIIMAHSVDTGLSKILLVIIPLMMGFIAVVAKFVIPLFTQMQKNVDKLNLVLRENLTGIRVIRAFNRQNYERERFGTANKNLTDVAIRVNRIMAFMQPVIMLFMNATTLLIIWFGGVRIAQSNLQIGDMMAFLQYAMQIMMSLIMVTVMFVMLPRAQASAVRVNEVIEMESSIEDNGVTIARTPQPGKIEFKDVSYRYHDAEEPVLRGITFTAEPGEITAIIGGTGSGKSTVVNLIPRFYDVESGQILVDGVDVREQPIEDLRGKLGFVSQSAILFSGTVAENIRYGNESATEEEMINAAEVAQAHDFISQLDKGYDSGVAQGGTNLSGGQRQRLSIARALIRRPEIYVFDDSFSALDFKTDAKLRAALKQEVGSATQIIIAQRISTIMDANKIIVINEGEVVGIGTHKELLKTCEVYGEIARSQLSEEELAHE